MSKKRRVVITGMGIASCFGTDVDQFYQKLLNGESGVRQIDAFDCSEYPTRIAAQVRDFSTDGYIDKKQARRIDPFLRYAMVAGKKALEKSSIDSSALEKLDKKRCGILIGSGMGGMTTYTGGVDTVKEKGFARLTPFFVPYIITNMASGLLAIDLGFMGPNYSVSSACATSNHAIYAAAEHIRKGDANLMLCGGSESAINLMGLTGFIACKALSERNDEPTKASRPWDKDRDGFVMGDGAAVLVLEDLEHALERGAPIFAEYLGGGMSCDAFHITSLEPEGTGVALCMENALRDAEIAPEEVNYINAHATSTLAGDLCEITGIRRVFKNLGQIKINAPKSAIGHTLGAAGAFESIVTIKAIQTGKIHPTVNTQNLDEGMEGIDVVLGKAVEHKVSAAVNNSFGFGGHNVSLIFAPYN